LSEVFNLGSERGRKLSTEIFPQATQAEKRTYFEKDAPSSGGITGRKEKTERDPFGGWGGERTSEGKMHGGQ